LPRAGVARLRSPRTKLLAGTLLLVCGLVLLGGFYRFSVEHPPGVARRVWPGAGAAVASWLAVSWAFGEYVTSMADYALYYGSLAAVATLLIWLYLTSLALVLGMEVNAELEGLR
jgi:membrane protein